MNPAVPYIFSILTILVLLLLAALGVGSVAMQYVCGVIVPYLAILTFVIGFIARISVVQERF